jgi:hypothetical protein
LQHPCTTISGPERQPIKARGSFQRRVDMLQERLAEQGHEIEEALALDPLAGRREIMQQEQKKMTKDLPISDRQRFSVREWQNMKHDDLRTIGRTERLQAVKAQDAGKLAAGTNNPKMKKQEYFLNL